MKFIKTSGSYIVDKQDSIHILLYSWHKHQCLVKEGAKGKNTLSNNISSCSVCTDTFNIKNVITIKKITNLRENAMTTQFNSSRTYWN